jgi:tetratricopeptide (TPR) repeat protein/TolB-like protein
VIRITIPSPASGEITVAELDVFSRVKSALADRYAIERELGQGGTAIVYLAQDLRHSRPVAIKVLRPELAAVVGADRFLHEIETVARLQHPHILPLYDSGEAGGLLYFVMMYAQGETLRDRLERERQLPVDDVVAIARDVISALSFAHRQDVIHRDIKPENILLIGGAAVVADFGIARALRIAGQGRMTDAGLALGTPLYMSPEQAAASGSIDARSDIYSLGCVIYEMLGGAPPFTGLSAGDVMAHHLHERPRPITDLRSTVPSPLALAIAKALQKLPADRFSSVAEFGEALRISSGERAPIALPVPRRVMTAAAALGILLLGITVYAKLVPGAEPAMANRYLVLPLQEVSGTPPAGAAGDQISVLLRQALTRWRDVTVVSVMQSNDIWRGGSAIQTLDDAIAAARHERAEYLVWGQQAAVGDSVRVDIALYRANRRGTTIRQGSAMLPPNAAEMGVRVSNLVRALVADSVGAQAGGSPLGTTSLSAWQAYAQGHSALADWRLPDAVAGFDRAAAIDPAFASAHYWGALLRAWSGSTQDWAGSARAAVALKDHLYSWRDTVSADALLAMAERRYENACREYRALIGRDSVDVIAWFGLGECLRRDRAVVVDRTSPSGWRFRSSLNGAIDAYHRAFDLAPAAAFLFGDEAFDRLRSAYFVEPGAMRIGRPLPPDSGTFGAFAALAGDSILLVPYRYPAVLRMTRPPTEMAAMERNRARLRTLAERWASAYPTSARAHGALARVLELTGDLGTDSAQPGTALGEYRAARGLAADSSTRVAYGAHEVRVLIKSGDIEAARRLADVLLQGWEQAPREAAAPLAGLAALLGHIEAAADLFARSQGDSGYAFSLRDGRYPPPLTRAALRFATYAAFGTPAESLPSLLAATERLLNRHVPPADRAAVWHELMDVPLAFAFPDIQPPTSYGVGRIISYSAIEADMAGGRTAQARAALELSRANHRAVRPGETALSTALLNARLDLALGDSASARQLLEDVLGDLAVAPTLLIDEPVQAASLVRAFALAADLARARGDQAQARRWAGNVVILWDHGDPPLRAVAERMRAF